MATGAGGSPGFGFCISGVYIMVVRERGVKLFRFLYCFKGIYIMAMGAGGSPAFRVCIVAGYILCNGCRGVTWFRFLRVYIMQWVQGGHLVSGSSRCTTSGVSPSSTSIADEDDCCWDRSRRPVCLPLPLLLLWLLLWLLLLWLLLLPLW